jgi:hypothetical protein
MTRNINVKFDFKIVEWYQRKKTLKIPKGQSESLYRRKTENTMARRKITKGQRTIYKTLHIQLKIE